MVREKYLCYYIIIIVVCRRLLQKIPAVTVEDLRRVGSQYMAMLFDPTRSKVVICCHPTKVDETVAELLSWWVVYNIIDLYCFSGIRDMFHLLNSTFEYRLEA